MGEFVSTVDSAACDTSPLRRPKILPALCAAVFACAGPPVALCATVSNCNDSGTGSLRAAVAAATSGSTIDLSHLACSTITLEDFEIVVPQHDLTIQGPRGGLTIAHDGAYDRIFNHQGSGTLTLNKLKLTGGDAYSTSTGVYGGCVFSHGNVYLSSTTVSYCTATTIRTGARAAGGGIYTAGALTMMQSKLERNSVSGTSGYGGGAAVHGDFVATMSSIEHNAAHGKNFSYSGGLNLNGSLTLEYSTVAENSATIAGGLTAFQHPNSTALIRNSTISGNKGGAVGGALLQIPLTIVNSTVAFNLSTTPHSSGQFYFSAGLAMSAQYAPADVDMENSVFSNNVYFSDFGPVNEDFSVPVGYVTVTGSHNFIYGSSQMPPADIATAGVCPLLAPLSDNGGPTRTHALFSKSPAIDAAPNVGALPFDQRGNPFMRSDGTSSTPVDLGAYEVQKADIVFSAGFDGC